MAKAESEIIVNAPIEDVFAYLSDTRLHTQWDEGLDGIVHEPDGPIQLGTKITEKRRFLGRPVETMSEVVEFDPPHKYTRSGEDPFPSRGTVTFEPVEEGTKVTFTLELAASGFFALAAPLLATALKNSTSDMLKHFKAKLENNEIKPIS